MFKTVKCFLVYQNSGENILKLTSSLYIYEFSTKEIKNNMVMH